MGGLGHFAVMWAAALGAEVTVISHTADKKEDAMKLGAKHFVLSTEKDWAKPLAFTFDFILNCADMTQEFKVSSMQRGNTSTFTHVPATDARLHVHLEDQLRVPQRRTSRLSSPRDVCFHLRAKWYIFR